MRCCTKFSKIGFSIIEILAAIAFFLVGVLALLKIFPYALRINKTSEEKTISTTLAQEKLEDLISLDYDSIPVGTMENNQLVSFGSVGNIYNFHRNTKVRYLDGNLNTSVSDLGLKEIEVSVSYRTGETGLTGSSTLKRLISRH